MRYQTRYISEVTLGLCPATISKYVVRELGVAVAREAMLTAKPVGAQTLQRLGCVAEVVAINDLDRALDTYLLRLRRAAPRASTMVKRLVKLAGSSVGEGKQERLIKEMFDQMMRKDGEAAFGIGNVPIRGAHLVGRS